MPLTDIELGWLAGTWDGEGSISANRDHDSWRLALQLSTTCERTAMEVVRLCEVAGVTACAYTYQEKKPDLHLPSWHLRIIRLTDVALMADLLTDVSVTKQSRWKLIGKLAHSRLEGAKFDTTGRVHRGGVAKPYTQQEMKWLNALRESGRRRGQLRESLTA